MSKIDNRELRGRKCGRLSSRTTRRTVGWPQGTPAVYMRRSEPLRGAVTHPQSGKSHVDHLSAHQPLVSVSSNLSFSRHCHCRSNFPPPMNVFIHASHSFRLRLCARLPILSQPLAMKLGAQQMSVPSRFNSGGGRSGKQKLHLPRWRRVLDDSPSLTSRLSRPPQRTTTRMWAFPKLSCRCVDGCSILALDRWNFLSTQLACADMFASLAMSHPLDQPAAYRPARTRADGSRLWLQTSIIRAQLGIH